MVATYLLFPDECLKHKVFDNRHEKKGMLNGIVILSKFPFENVWTWDSTLLLILNIFSVFKKGEKKALIPKLNPVYWTEFISFRVVRTASTQLPTGLEIEKKTAQNRLLHFIFTWVFEMEKKLFFHGSHYYFSPSSQLKFSNDLILLYFPWFSQRVSKDTNILHILVCMQNNRLKAY